MSCVRLVLSWTVERLAEAVLTGLRGFPARFLDVLLDLTAQFDLQLLGFYLQILLPVCKRFPCLKKRRCVMGVQKHLLMHVEIQMLLNQSELSQYSEVND